MKMFLVAHMKVHSDGDLKCEVCQIWFTRNSLVVHLKRSHPGQQKELFSKARAQIVSKEVIYFAHYLGIK